MFVKEYIYKYMEEYIYNYLQPSQVIEESQVKEIRDVKKMYDR